MYLNDIYKIKDYIKIGKGILDALEKEDFQIIVDFYNTFLAEFPYDGLGDRNEYWYRALFLLLLRCVGIIGYAEVHTIKGRSDIVVQLDRQIIVIEFKLAENAEAVDSKRQEGIDQIRKLGYAKAYEGTSRKVATVVIVASDDIRQATLQAAGALPARTERRSKREPRGSLDFSCLRWRKAIRPWAPRRSARCGCSP